MTSIKKALITASQLLAGTSNSPMLDAEVLLAHALHVNRTFLYAHGTDLIDENISHTYQTLVNRRVEGQPVAYLVGHREFWSLPFKVNTATLIPRPETELLVQTTLDILGDKKNITILDLGTGSGAIAIALAHSRPDWDMTAVDINAETLHVAQHNAAQHQVTHIRFIQSDWFDNMPHELFDAIVSNPPYIKNTDSHLQEGDVRFEPLIALTSGEDGLDAIRTITERASLYLKPKGILLLEHGYDQAEAVEACLKKAEFEQIRYVSDLQGHPRVSIGYRR